LFDYLAQGFSLGLPAGALPGPFMAYLFSKSIQNGWRRTLPAALAPLFSDAPIIIVMVLILTRMPPLVLVIIQMIGGCFILYLAYQAFQTFLKGADEIEIRDEQNAEPQSLVEATTMNLLNPNPYIFWGTAGALVLVDGWQRSPVLGASFLLAFYVTMISVSATLIVIFGVARRFGPRVIRWLSGASAVALFAFGMVQLVTGFIQLIGWG